MAMSFICLASLGRCSLIRMPGTAVSIALNGPPLAWPGLRSKVSIWLGPPVIQSRMHDFRRFGIVGRVGGQGLDPAGRRDADDAGRGQAEHLAPRQRQPAGGQELVRFMACPHVKNRQHGWALPVERGS